MNRNDRALSDHSAGLARNRWLSSALLSALSVVAALMSVVLYARDRSSRVAPVRFATEFTMNIRRPELAATLQYAPSGDFASDLLADGTLRDVLDVVNLNGVPPDARAAWIDAPAHFDEQMSRAVDLMLDSVRERPGWPYHESLLGQVAYTRDARTLSGDLVNKYERWRTPFLAGASGAGSDDALWQALAVAYLQTWPSLARTWEPTSSIVFRRAFEDDEFVKNTFGSALALLGTERAVRDLPDSPRSLWQAFQQIAKSGDLETAWTVHQRWDAAEWRQRGIDLAKAELHAARGDTADVRRLCEGWTGRHSVWNYDSPAAHAQAARLLELWPAGRQGKWNGDPRGEIVRYFLAGRTREVKGTILARVTDNLTGVPLPIQAQVKVLAGDVYGADSLARSAGGFGSFEWTPYLLELSRYWLRSNNAANAAAALAQLAPGAREECDAAILRRIVQRGPDKDSRRPALEQEAGSKEPIEIGRDYALCLSSGSGESLIVNVSAVAPLVLDYGWDGARSATVVIDATHKAFAIALPRAEGRRRLMTRVASGKSAGSMTATWRYSRAGIG